MLAIDGGAPVRNRDWPRWPPAADDAQHALLREVVDGGDWGSTSGRRCDEFTSAFAARHGCAHGVAVANGTLALFAALHAVGVRPGDEVVVPGYTFVACASSVLLLGATPVIADVDPDHLHLTAATVEPALTARTRAVMAVHLAGSPAPMDELAALARRKGLAVVEDAAQAHGAGYRGRPVGCLGDVATFSFQSSKAMTAGEGGIVTTADGAVADAAWSVCNLGRVRGGAWYHHAELGWNLRMTELQAALLLPWLDRLDAEIDRREDFARRLSDSLAGLPVRVVADPAGTDRDTRHLLMLRLDEDVHKPWVVRAMAAEGVPVDAGYPGLGRLTPVAERAVVLPTPAVDRAGASVVWLRQNVLMAGPDGVRDVLAALERVLTDPRATSGTGGA
ncbi:DegT/DnrJ/EryC1/StrS family aminotransferase [Actinophytocola gossypii]|uniref:DegT/DnrJ/EryC1/StrS family aminotransferase n=1 Tax=Actinophytocola gossypii TaxID=2812003 RepID=A0ABT2J5Q1_9PSEU|nr:DegT/DnrJ/EryC1/StrS family aminotransferase [Actinophytocola gossypii]MCT2583096.1 DegT/DnrJ/EryC1/StrS family aminotransferase [Actinophytocola gossypii]